MKIHVRLGNGWEKELAFTSDTLTFGSGPQNDVVLPAPDILPLHFRLVRSGAGLCCVVYGRNLTLQRGGEPAAELPNGETALRDGDSLWLGSAQIRIHFESAVKRRFSFLYALLAALLLFLSLAGIGVVSRPRIEDFRLSTDPDGLRSLSWETGGFFVTARIDDGETLRSVPAQGSIPIQDGVQGRLDLLAENGLSRLFRISARRTLIVPSVTPEPTARPTERAEEIPIELKLESEETAPNVVYLRWEIQGGQGTTGQLRIGSETIFLTPERFNGERTVRLTEDADVELTASDGRSEKSERLRLSYRPPKTEILKFIVWLESEPGAAKEKIAEAVPDPRADGAYRVQTYRSVELKKGRRLLIEWDVRDADTLTIDPLSNRLLPLSGAAAYVPNESVNFTMTAIGGGRRLDVSIPIRFERDSALGAGASASAQRTATPVRTRIDFFRANPVTLSEAGETTVAWSVSGPYAQIRLIDGDREIAADLAASGLRKIPVRNDLTLMLQVDSPTGSVSALETVRVKADTTVMRPTSIRLNSIFPKKDSYVVGERVQFGVAFASQSGNRSDPTGSVLIGDGVSSCVVTLPRDYCELLLRADGERTFSIRYSGDRNYLPSSAAAELSVKPFVRRPVNLRLTTYRDRLVFAPGDKIRLIAEPDPGDISGTLFFSDGVRSCLVTLPRNSCELTALEPGSARIRVVYSGDETYAPAESELTVVSSLIEATATPPPVPIRLAITQLFPERETYALGDTVDVYVSLSNSAGLEGTYKNRVRVSDGISACYLNPNISDHCSLRFVQARRARVQAEYPGDEIFGSAAADPVDINVLPEALPTATPNANRIPTELAIVKVYPDRQSFTAGDTIEVYVSLTNSGGADREYGGRVRISDGISVCTLNPNLTSSCSIKLVHPQNGKLTAAYAGDETFLPSAAERPIAVRPSPKLPSLTVIGSVEPRKDAYDLNETIAIKVEVKEKNPGSGKTPGGPVLVRAGAAACEIAFPAESSCTLTLTDPNAVEITAEYAGDDSFAPSVAAAVPLRLRPMEMTLSLLAEKYIGGDCRDGIPDGSDPIAATAASESGTEIRLFTLDGRFKIGSGFYLDAAVELRGGLFEDTGGTFNATVCAVDAPEVCVESGDVSADAPPVPSGRLSARIKLPPPVHAGRYTLTVSFRAENPAFGTVRERAVLDRIYPGQLMLIPDGGTVDYDARRVTLENHDAAPERDRTLEFGVFLIRDPASACAISLTDDFPAPVFSTIESRVSSDVPGAEGSDAAWKQAFRDQGVPDELVDRLQPNRMNWYGDRCQFDHSSGRWRLSCRQVGLTEPSRLIFSGDVGDPNYQTDESSKIPIDIAIGKHAAAILPAEGWNAPAVGTVYWLNARGEDFNYWAAERCDDSAAEGFQTSVSRIPSDQILTVEAKLLSRALSDRLRLRDAEGFVTVSPASQSQWTVLPTYHGVCGSCSPRAMMNFNWIANEGCSFDGASLTVTEKNGSLFGGQTCENNRRKQVGIRSGFCQIRVDGPGEILFSLPESESQLAATLRLTGGRGRGLPLETRSEPGNSQPFRAEIALVDGTSAPIQSLFVGETARFKITLNRSLAEHEKIRILVPPFLTHDYLTDEPSGCLRWSVSGSDHWELDSTRFVRPDPDSERTQAECTLTFRAGIENADATAFRIQYPDGAVSEWSGFPSAVRKSETIVVPSLKLILSSDLDDTGTEQISDARIGRLYPDDLVSTMNPLARYRFDVRLTDSDGISVSPSADDRVLIRSALFSALDRLGCLDACWERAEDDGYRVGVGESCGFVIPPRGVSRSELGAIEISLDSPRIEGARIIEVSGSALDPEAIAIRASVPAERRVGEDSEIRFTADADRSDYASAWLSRNGAKLLSIGAAPDAIENCSDGLQFDASGTARCLVGGSSATGEAITLIVQVEEEAVPNTLIFSLLDGNGAALSEIALPPPRLIGLSGSIGTVGISDHFVIESDVLVEFRLNFDSEKSEPFAVPDEIVRIDAPVFHSADVGGTCADLTALPWIADESGGWIKRCDFRWTATRRLTDPERTIFMTAIDERYGFSDGRTPTLTLPDEVRRLPLRLTTAVPLPAVRIGSETVNWTIQIDSGGVPIDPALFSVRANETDELDCRFSEDRSAAECVLTDEIPGDLIRLRAAYSGDRIHSEAVLDAEPIQLKRFALNVVPLESPEDSERAPLSLPRPDDSENQGAYLYRDELDRIKFRFFSLNGDVPDDRESCAAPPDGFSLEVDLELAGERKQAVFGCVSPERFGETLICELSSFGNADFDPESLRRIDRMALTFPGDECFEPLRTELAFEPTAIVDFFPVDTIFTGETIEIEVPAIDWESLTAYCDQDGVPLTCRIDGYERDCRGIPVALPAEDGTVSIAAANAYAPVCEFVGTDRDGRIWHGAAR